MDPEIPQRPLGEEARARRRAELLAAVAAEGTVPERRWLVPAAAAVAVAAVGLAAWLTVGLLGGQDGSPASPAAGSASAEPSATDPVSPPSPGAEASSSSPEPECEPVDPFEQGLPEKGMPWDDPVVGPVLRAYRDILAGHLDPGGEHLDIRVTNMQSGGDAGCGFSHLGTKLGWSVPGEGGLGMVQVEVNRGPRSDQIRLYHQDWRPVRLEARGVEEARVAEHAGGIAVIVTRTDGLTVAIDASSLFGNNSTEAISGFGFGVDALLEAAADPRFRLP